MAKVPQADDKANSKWLNIIDQEPPRFTCPVINEQLVSPCQLRGCILWQHNPKAYSCLGAFASMKASDSEERLQATSASQRDKRKNLRASTEGRLSFFDLAHAYGFSRPKAESYVTQGFDIVQTMSPMFVNIDFSEESPDRAARHPIGPGVVFTHAAPVSHVDKSTGEITRVCVCCETTIEHDDTEQIIAIVDRNEVAWCSRECARELTIDGYLLASKTKRHWAAVIKPGLSEDQIKIRELTNERLEALRLLAVKQGY